MMLKMNKKVLEGIEKCASLYGFDVADAIEKIMASKKKVKVVAPKASFALPFSGEMKERCCEGLRYNDGLYTQCEVIKKGENKYCAVCEKGNLKYGTIRDRMDAGLMEFKDPSGKSPVHYSKIMKKLKLTREAVLEEGEKMGNKVHPIHLEVQEEKRGRPKALKEVKEKAEKKKGRPKKEPKGLELENKTTDLFASLIANSVSECDNLPGVSEMVAVVSSPAPENDETNKLDKLFEKGIKAQEKEYSKALEKAKKDEEKALEKAKKDEEKALEKAKKELEKAKKELEKAKKDEEKALEKALEKAKKAKKDEEKALEKKVLAKVVKEEEADTVERITQEGVKCKSSHPGVQYLKSKKSGIVYNMEQDVIGKWDEESKKIIFNAIKEELEEDECDSDSE